MAYRTLYFRRDDGTKINRYFIFDTAAELLTDTLILGDLGYTIDTDTLYIADSSTSWSAVSGGGGGTGTVTTVSVVTANGLAGSVANATTTPAITLSTPISGLLKGNGTAISAASAGTDYYAPGSTDVAVADGGTGVSSLTAYAPLFGGTTGTGAVQSGTLGSSGQVLTSNGAGALATFQAAAASPFNFLLAQVFS